MNPFQNQPQESSPPSSQPQSMLLSPSLYNMPYYICLPTYSFPPILTPNSNSPYLQTLPTTPVLGSFDHQLKTNDPIDEGKQKSKNSDINSNIQVEFCRCSKSHCRKEYCFCFKNGRSCTEKCICIGCKNNEDSLNIKHGFKKLSMVTCNCSRSKCEKKYCECYAAGKKCGEHCNCQDCKNG